MKLRYALIPLLLLCGGCTEKSVTTPELEERVFNILGGLEVGETFQLSGANTEEMLLAGAPGGAVYLYVPFYASADASANLDLIVMGEGIAPKDRAAGPVVIPRFHIGKWPGPEMHRNYAFHERLRLSERKMTRYFPAARMMRSRRQQETPASPPAVGQLLMLNANPNQACDSPDFRSARIAAVSNRAIIAVDATNPAGGLSDEQLHEVAAAFDTLVYPVDTGTFGEPSDIDENGRVIIFYTKAVNELTPPGSDSYVGGFFWVRDLFPRDGGSGDSCAGSNEAELFYMLAPDPHGEVNGNKFSAEFIENETIGVTGHEFEHLINASRRIFLHHTDVLEDAWLDEGLAHIAEEQLFYRASGFEPGQNLDIDDILASQRAVDAYNEFGSGNIGRYTAYLEAPSKESPMGADATLETRGAMWSFLRYLSDHLQDSDQIFFELANSTSSGLTNLSQVIGPNALGLLRSWTVSVYADDEVPGAAAIYTQPSWNFRSILEYLKGPASGFPLKTLDLTSTTPVAARIPGGGAAFLEMRTLSEAPATVRAASSAGQVDDLTVSVMRIR